MSLPLLYTKLYAPPPRPQRVQRAHLLDRLRNQVACPLTLICAPAGFGKTTLVSEWINDLRDDLTDKPTPANQKSKIQNPQIAWLSLEEDENDPTRFLTYVIAALQTCQAHVGETALALLAAPQIPPAKTILTLLLNDLATLTVPLVLVLDDYHVITTPAIHEALTFLIDHLPPHLHLIITSRMDPPLPLARWRVRNQLTEVRADELRFTSEETAIFLNDVMGLTLTPTEIAALETRTEGWIAGLQLAALSLRGGADREHFVASFAGVNRLILDYLVEEVLHQQPAAVQHFLLHTAILDRLCAPLCDALLARSDSQAILEQLERANLFLLPLDQERQWYRYHQLFAETLRHLLRQQPSAPVVALYQRSGAWHEATGVMDEAVRYARYAEDWPRIAQIIEQQAMIRLGRGEATTLRHWLDLLPVTVLRVRPYLHLVYAWIAVLAAQYAEVETHLQAAETALTSKADGVLAHLPAVEIMGQIAAVRTLLAVHQHEPDRARTLGQRALQAVPVENRYVRAMLLYALGLVEWSSDNAAAARAHFGEVSRLGNRLEQRVITVAALNNLGGLQEVQGKLRLAAQSYQQALRLASEESGAPLPLASMAYLGLGFLYREWHELAAAEEHLRTSIALSQRGGFAVPEALGWFGLALTHQAQGDDAHLAATLAEAETLVRRWGEVAPPVQINLYQARLALLRQDWLAAATFCQEPSTGHLPQEWRAANAIMQARVLLAQGQTRLALARLQDLLALAEEAERGWHSRTILVLQSLAQHKLGDPAAAGQTLDRALTLAEPEGYVHLFTDEGAALIPLLRQAAVRGVMVAYVAKLLAVLEQPPLPSTPPGVEPLLEPLSERELEVLRLMAAGLQNQAIADELVVVLGTVKAHINHIYQKLGVANRVQAITRARQLRLL